MNKTIFSRQNLNEAMQRQQKQGGFSSILLVIAVLAIVGVFVLYLYNTINSTEVPGLDVGTSKIMRVNTDATEKSGKYMMQESFEELEEDDTTPEEINNESLSELDALFEGSGSFDADFSDLEI